MRKPDSYLACEGALVHQTVKAWLIRFGDIEHWMPKSKCFLEKMEGTINQVKLTAPEWLLQKKGLL